MLNVPDGREHASTHTMGSVSLEAMSDANGPLGVSGGGFEHGGGGSDVEDIDGLFGHLDWATANFTQLEAQWRSDLASIEKDNVAALMESGERGQSLLPSLTEAIRATQQVEELAAEYTRQLKLMGQEVSQIAGLNHALDLQARNQEALLAELSKIIGSLEVPADALRALGKPDFGSAPGLEMACLAATIVYGVINGKFEKGIKEMRGVAERLDVYRSAMAAFEEALLAHLSGLLKLPVGKAKRAKLHGLETLCKALGPFAPLLQLLGRAAPGRFAQFRLAFEETARHIVTQEVAEAFEFLKQNCLLTKTPDEKPSFLLSSNRPTSGFDFLKAPKGTSFVQHKAFGTVELPELGVKDRLLPEQLLEYMLLLVVETSGHLFDTLLDLFYPAEAHEENEALNKIGQLIDTIFANMQELLLTHVVEALLRTDKLSAYAFIGLVERRLPEVGPEIPAMDLSLRAIMEACKRTADEHIKAQVEAIQESRFSAKKRSGVFPSVAIFPVFVRVLEAAVRDAPPNGKARALVDAAYKYISTAIFASLSALMAEASQTDDEKDNLNAAIMTVQNAYSLMEALKAMQSPALEPIVRQCKEEFARNLSNYAYLSLPRLLGRLPDYFEGIQRLLQTGDVPPEEAQFQPGYDRTTARKLLASFTLKEAKRSVDSLRERVQKHYGAGDVLVPLVWQALANYAKERAQEYVEVIAKVYPASDVQLAFSADEVYSLFR